MSSSKRRVGIVGYGSLGRHLASCVLGDPSLELWYYSFFIENLLDPNYLLALKTA